MNRQVVLHRRLANQFLDQPVQQSVAEVVRWFGAVQSQEFNDAKWSVAQRINGLTHDGFMAAFNAGHILRTHVLRPTWHFVAPADIRWMLLLTAPRIKAVARTYERKLGLDDAVYAQINALIEEALTANTYLTRPEVADVLLKNGFSFKGNGLALIMIRAELDGIVCSGPMRGKQHTYALLEQRVPPAQVRTRDEALAELTERYVASHGPATAQDVSWWSGLTLTDARLGLNLCGNKLTSETINGNTYWYVPAAEPKPAPPEALLLPNFDEYVVAYAERSTLLPPAYDGPLRTQGNILFEKMIILDGEIAGTWRVDRAKKNGSVSWQPLQTLSASEEALLDEAVRRYNAFYAPI